jgi:maleylpyruvate isomerase
VSDLVLHTYWRSSAAYRVRIGLALKGLDWRPAPEDLVKGSQQQAAYLALNPQGLIPTLEADGAVLTQSLAILEWLDETHPAPPLLPADALGRAGVRAMAQIVACDIHPLQNLRVGGRLRETFGADGAAVRAWFGHWIAVGFDALEPLVARHGRGFAWGDAPTLADCLLVPQAYNAERHGLTLADWPRIAAAVATARAHPAFAAAHPDAQADAPQMA